MGMILDILDLIVVIMGKIIDSLVNCCCCVEHPTNSLGHIEMGVWLIDLWANWFFWASKLLISIDGQHNNYTFMLKIFLELDLSL